MKTIVALCTCLGIMLFICDADAKVGVSSGLQLPRFAVIKSKEANMRNGPSNKYPILWEYTCSGYPVKIIDEYDNWRRVVDVEGNDGWFHVSLLSNGRNVIVTNNKMHDQISLSLALPKNQLLLFRSKDEKSYPLARVKVGSIGRVLKCDETWCMVRFGKIKGWIRRDNLWGVLDGELLK